MIRLRNRSSSPAPATKIDPKIKVCIDSGAFSAWRLKKSVDLNAYCDWLKANESWIAHYVALDVIMPNDPETAAKLSFDNLLTMRKHGLDPIPVFHVGEDISWLDRMLDIGCKYIGLSATSLATKGAIDQWYRLAWARLVDAAGDPVVNVHAFGDTRLECLFGFPWASADSSSWITRTQKFGSVFFPGMPVLTQYKNMLSTYASDVDRLAGDDMAIYQRLVQDSGLDMRAILDRKSKSTFYGRTYLGARYFVDMQERVRAQIPVCFYNCGFLDRQSIIRKGHEQVSFDLFMVVGGNHAALPALHLAGATNILCSYYYSASLDHVKSYVADPCGAITRPPYAKHHAIYQQILNKELAA